MARKVTSQWQFAGDLFGKPTVADTTVNPTPTREVVDVGAFTRRLRDLLEGQFGTVWLRGEVSNYRLQSSGHAYFVLKDSAASINCVLFRGQTGVSRAFLRDGASVILGGVVTVYEPRGQYQLRVTAAEAEGTGALQAAFEELKRRLDAEGLFAPGRKRPIPHFPRGVGIVTSATGAALQDILHVLGRRCSALQVILAPARVQGAGAAEEIVRGVQHLNEWARLHGTLDVVLVTRGGGSLEDLWPFNEEVVARAIAGSSLPVISAVGHEIDFTISDFVADLRAATPSAAAEILTAGYVFARERICDLAVRFPRLGRSRLHGFVEDIENLQRRLGRFHPRRRLEDQGQHLDELSISLHEGFARAFRDRRRLVEGLAHRLIVARPSTRLARARKDLTEYRRGLLSGMRRALGQRADRLSRLFDRLRLLSPEAVLARGYSITLDVASGRVIRSAREVAPGWTLETRVAEGRLRSIVVPDEPGPR